MRSALVYNNSLSLSLSISPQLSIGVSNPGGATPFGKELMKLKMEFVSKNGKVWEIGRPYQRGKGLRMERVCQATVSGNKLLLVATLFLLSTARGSFHTNSEPGMDVVNDDGPGSILKLLSL